MTYETAKRLKDAGFPQRKEWEAGYFYCVDCKEIQLFKDDPDEGNFVGNDYGHRWKDRDAENWMTIPTSDELIRELDVFPNQLSLYGRDRDRWEATLVHLPTFGAEITPNEKVYASTPDEALAELYILIHANNKTKKTS